MPLEGDPKCPHHSKGLCEWSKADELDALKILKEEVVPAQTLESYLIF